ncbi:MAG: hypothetical protein JOZ96_05090 [Acidobacteria bacterium]|nr:hypothetical protein [Acidobacteriota bacterium]
MDTGDLWRFFPLGYLVTVAFETPVLVLLLSKHHPPKRRLFAGLWLTACTYPVVVLVLPPLFEDYSRAAYLAVAETFAPVAECALFYFTFKGEEGGVTWRDMFAVVVANLLSFLAGEVLAAYGWFGLFR